MTTNGTNRSNGRRDKVVSASLIAGALLAGLAAVAAQRRSVAAIAPTPTPVAAPAPETPPPAARPATPPPAARPATPAPKEPITPVAQAARPKVDLVFALDTTGSMSGLIEGAKTKIWSIASFVARAQPTPDVRVGLVAYRDVGDAYVTRVFDLDSDLDRVYRRLLSFRADGGGDTPEHVARALDEAVHKMSWGPANGNAVRLIYLVGDAPPHLDYADGYDYAKAARAAAARGIQVHAIRCGTDPDTATYWRKIASLGHGEFLTIDQNGGMRDHRTPYDEELARLHDELDDTVVGYGAKGGATHAALEAAAAAPVAVKAARAGFLSAKKDSSETIADDLVGSVTSGRVDLDKVAPSDLPKSMAAMAPAARKQEVAKKAKERADVLNEIATISAKRDAYLKKSPEKPTGFDGEVQKTVERAGSAAGLKF
jgi:Mg-chelatase subunit ChlD